MIVNTIQNKMSFVVRIDGKGHLLFKDKKRLISEVASKRKGKIHTKLMYKGENIYCYISYTIEEYFKAKKQDYDFESF